MWNRCGGITILGNYKLTPRLLQRFHPAAVRIRESKTYLHFFPVALSPPLIDLTSQSSLGSSKTLHP